MMVTMILNPSPAKLTTSLNIVHMGKIQSCTSVDSDFKEGDKRLSIRINQPRMERVNKTTHQ